MHIAQHICKPGSAKANEDAWGHAGNTVWVLDGATGLSDSPLIETAPSDPAWLVDQFNAYFTEHAPGFGADLTGLVSAAIQHVRALFEAQKCRKVAHNYELPVATLVMVHAGPQALTWLTLSDSYLITQTDGSTQMFGGDPVHEAIDAHSISELIRLRREGVRSLTEARQRLIPTIRAGRERANNNKADGYAALGIEMGVEATLAQHTLPRPSGPALLISDGFSRLIDTFKTHTAATLLDAATQQPLEALYTQLREIENNDPEGITYPRLKKSDDATAVLVTL